MKLVMQVITETELLERINDFRARHNDMAPTTFGRNATGNANMIKELEEGKSPSLRTVQRIVGYMDTADAEAATRAKLAAPIDPPPASEEEIALPFAQAPVNPTGASSVTSSSTSALPTPSPDSERSRCSSAATEAAIDPGGG